MKNKKAAIIGFLIGVVLTLGAFSIWTIYVDDKIGNMYYSKSFAENYIEILAFLQDYDNEIATAEYTAILIERQAKAIERTHKVKMLNYTSKKVIMADKALTEVLKSLEIMKTKINNEEKLAGLGEGTVMLNEAVENYLEVII